jgi:hypothetical protein
MIAVINAHMLGTAPSPREHVDWNAPDIMPEDDWTDLVGDVAEYAANNPHMIVWDEPVLVTTHEDGTDCDAANQPEHDTCDHGRTIHTEWK